MILTNTVLEAKYFYLFLPEGAKKNSKFFFTALIIPKKTSHQVNRDPDLIFLFSLSGLTPTSPQGLSCQPAGKGG